MAEIGLGSLLSSMNTACSLCSHFHIWQAMSSRFAFPFLFLPYSCVLGFPFLFFLLSASFFLPPVDSSPTTFSFLPCLIICLFYLTHLVLHKSVLSSSNAPIPTISTYNGNVDRFLRGGDKDAWKRFWDTGIVKYLVCEHTQVLYN